MHAEAVPAVVKLTLHARRVRVVIQRRHLAIGHFLRRCPRGDILVAFVLSRVYPGHTLSSDRHLTLMLLLRRRRLIIIVIVITCWLRDIVVVLFGGQGVHLLNRPGRRCSKKMPSRANGEPIDLGSGQEC